MKTADLVILLMLLTVRADADATQTPTKPLPEGIILQGIDGTLLRDANDTWLFELSVDVNNPGGAVHGGAQIELLPCTILERAIADVNDRYTPEYRLWALVTAYHGRNYLLPRYDLLPLSKRRGDQPAAADGQGGRQQAEPNNAFHLPDANDPELTIPPEVVEKLRDRRATPRAVAGDAERRPEGGSTSSAPQSLGRMVVDEIGRIGIDAEGPIFTPDAFGWNMSATRYRLLPCKMLEQVQQRQAVSPEPLRFNVAGIVTEFQGNKYLLLQRTARVYNYGNFGR